MKIYAAGHPTRERLNGAFHRENGRPEAEVRAPEITDVFFTVKTYPMRTESIALQRSALYPLPANVRNAPHSGGQKAWFSR